MDNVGYVERSREPQFSMEVGGNGIGRVVWGLLTVDAVDFSGLNRKVDAPNESGYCFLSGRNARIE